MISTKKLCKGDCSHGYCSTIRGFGKRFTWCREQIFWKSQGLLTVFLETPQLNAIFCWLNFRSGCASRIVVGRIKLDKKNLPAWEPADFFGMDRLFTIYTSKSWHEKSSEMKEAYISFKLV